METAIKDNRYEIWFCSEGSTPFPFFIGWNDSSSNSENHLDEIEKNLCLEFNKTKNEEDKLSIWKEICRVDGLKRQQERENIISEMNESENVSHVEQAIEELEEENTSQEQIREENLEIGNASNSLLFLFTKALRISSFFKK